MSLKFELTNDNPTLVMLERTIRQQGPDSVFRFYLTLEEADRLRSFLDLHKQELRPEKEELSNDLDQ